MSDREDANGTASPPAIRRLALEDLQGFCMGPSSRERVLSLLEKTTAGELLQQTAAAADALALQQEASTPAQEAAARRAAAFAAAPGDDDAAEDPQQLLNLLLKTVKKCFEVEELRDSILSQPELSSLPSAAATGDSVSCVSRIMRPLLAAAAASSLTPIRELLAQQLRQIAKRGERGKWLLH
ncbi:hypothetical protein ACSSS7_005208 [Eimeria intestinalis]